MQSDTGLVYRGNFLLIQEYLTYLLQVKMKNPKSVERYRFWLNHLLLWAMEMPLQKAQFIKTPFADYVKHKKFAAESQKKIVERRVHSYAGQSYIMRNNLPACRLSG